MLSFVASWTHCGLFSPRPLSVWLICGMNCTKGNAWRTSPLPFCSKQKEVNTNRYYDKAISVFLCMEDNTIVVDFGHDDVGGQECKDGRSRTWMLLLYPDNPEHNAVLEGKLSELDWNYAGRAHDQEGKLHHHVVVLFKDGRKNADIAADLGIEKRWLRAWDRQKKALRYLCHRDNLDKYQYSTDGIYGTIAEKAVAACSKGDALSESQAVSEIVNMLDSIDGIVSYSFFLGLMAEKGYFSVFRRMGIIAVRLIDEHNNGIRAKDARLIQRDWECNQLREFLKKIDDLPFEERCEILERKGYPPMALD